MRPTTMRKSCHWLILDDLIWYVSLPLRIQDIHAKFVKKTGVYKEAAYNLVLIYTTTGGAVAAQDIAAKWLSF